MPMSNRELDRAYRRTYRRLITGVLIAYGAGLMVVLTLLISHPRIANWMSEAFQAELGITVPPAQQPTRLAQPSKSVRTVRVD